MVEGEYAPRAPETEVEREKKWRRPYEIIAGRVGLSADRLRRLLNTGRVEGRKERKKGRGYPWRWLTTVQSVEKYKSSLLTPREYGRRGGRPRKRKAAAA